MGKEKKIRSLSNEYVQGPGSSLKLPYRGVVIITCFANEAFKAEPSQITWPGSLSWWMGNLKTNMIFRLITTWSYCFQNPFYFTPEQLSDIPWMFSLFSQEPRWLALLIGAIAKSKSSQSSCCVPKPFLYTYFCEVGGRTLASTWLSLPPAGEISFSLSKMRATSEFCSGVASSIAVVDVMESGLAFVLLRSFWLRQDATVIFPWNWNCLS